MNTKTSNADVVASYVLYDFMRVQSGLNTLSLTGDMQRAAKSAAAMGDHDTAAKLGTLAEAMHGRWSVPDLIRALQAEPEAA